MVVCKPILVLSFDFGQARLFGSAPKVCGGGGWWVGGWVVLRPILVFRFG